MKRTVCLFVIICSFIIDVNSQVKWSFTSKKINDKTYELKLHAEVNSPWHIYSQNTPEGGPLPTKITFFKNPLVVLNGKIKEAGSMKIKHEEIFDVDVMYYETQVVFIQSVQLKTAAKTNISGEIEYMVCNEQQCMPPAKEKFNVKLE